MVRIKLIMWALLVGSLFTGCSRNNGCTPVSVGSERAQLEAFNASIGMNATLDSRGFFHEILVQGSNNRPQQVSTIFVRYKGTFLDGKVFDQQTVPGATGFVLNNLIDGWKYALPMIGKGGKIRISVPSALAYGCQGESRGSVAIPPNTPLYFELELVDFF